MIEWSQTHDEVDVEKEADMEHEVGRARHYKTPHVDRASSLEAVDKE